MKISTVRHNKAVWVKVTGSVDFSSFSAFTVNIRSQGDREKKNVVLDLSQVTGINRFGMDALPQLAARVKRLGGVAVLLLEEGSSLASEIVRLGFDEGYTVVHSVEDVKVIIMTEDEDSKPQGRETEDGDLY